MGKRGEPIETLAHDALLDGADARHGAGDVQALERHRPVTERLERLLGPEHTGERSLVARAEQRDQVRLAGAGRLPHLEREPADGRHAFPPACAERRAPGIAPRPLGRCAVAPSERLAHQAHGRLPRPLRAHGHLRTDVVTVLEVGTGEALVIHAQSLDGHTGNHTEKAEPEGSRQYDPDLPCGHVVLLPRRPTARGA